jgi:hypothetical protein
MQERYKKKIRNIVEEGMVFVVFGLVLLFVVNAMCLCFTLVAKCFDFWWYLKL